jgi:tripartite-type tricarboxylate transporter receptor subunit TctC
MISILTRCGVLALSMYALCAPAMAQQKAWPSGPIKIVVPFPPGGSVDMVARSVGKYLGDVLGQPVVVDNRSGASGNIGAEFAARAAPDGQTLFVYSSGVLAANQFLYKRTGFDPLKDFSQVIRLAEQPNILLVHPSAQVGSVKDLVAKAKAEPGKVTMGSAGIGTGQDISARQFASMTGIDLLHVPYRGGAPALSDLLGGQIQSMFETSPTALQHAREGKQLRAIAITSERRSALLPDLPTVAESGVPGYVSTTWIGLAAPAKTPAAVIERLNRELNKALEGDMGRQFSDIALERSGGTVHDVDEALRRDAANYGKILKDAGVEPQ